MPTPLRLKPPTAAWIVTERRRLGLKPRDVASRMNELAACSAPAAPAVTPAPATPTAALTATLVPTAATYTITGTFTLIDSDLGGTAKTCWGQNGYDDIGAGTNVVVKNEAGIVVGASDLGAGSLSELVVCTFRFEVDRLPRATFYAVEVSHRGELTYSFEEIESRDWRIALTLD